MVGSRVGLSVTISTDKYAGFDIIVVGVRWQQGLYIPTGLESFSRSYLP